MADPTTVEIVVDETEDRATLPPGVLDVFTAEGQPPAEAVGDLLTLACTQRLHGFVAHSHDDPGEEMRDLESAMREQFEERFGASFAEVTGHSH